MIICIFEVPISFVLKVPFLFGEKIVLQPVESEVDMMAQAIYKNGTVINTSNIGRGVVSPAAKTETKNRQGSVRMLGGVQA